MSNEPQDAGRLRGEPPAGRYTLDITEDDKGDNPITISLEVEDSSIVRISARDVEGNIYEGAFHLRRVQKAPKPPGPGEEAGDHGGGDDDDDECQICGVENGRTVCRTVVC